MTKYNTTKILSNATEDGTKTQPALGENEEINLLKERFKTEFADPKSPYYEDELSELHFAVSTLSRHYVTDVLGRLWAPCIEKALEIDNDLPSEKKMSSEMHEYLNKTLELSNLLALPPLVGLLTGVLNLIQPASNLTQPGLTITQVERIKQLINERIACINVKNKNGDTVLHLAAYRGNGEIVESLLTDPRIDPGIKGKYGETPLHLAAEEGHSGSVDLLLKRGANPDTQNVYGYAALHLAAGRGHIGSTKLLIEAGAALDVKSAIGTPLYHATMRDRAEVIELLIGAGADPNIQNRNGETILHWAARGGHTEIVTKILSTGLAKKLDVFLGEGCSSKLTDICHTSHDFLKTLIKYLCDDIISEFKDTISSKHIEYTVTLELIEEVKERAYTHVYGIDMKDPETDPNIQVNDTSIPPSTSINKTLLCNDDAGSRSM